MKMEFLDATGNGEYPNAFPKFLIRLSEFTDEERLQLVERIQTFLLQPDQSLGLHHLPFIQPIDCCVTLKQSKENEGLTKTGEGNEYSCSLTLSGYQQMIEIINHTDAGHNWLTPEEYFDEPAFLLSKYGPW